MGGRVTRSQSREILRAKTLQQALESGASPSFLPPTTPSAAEPSSLSWNPPTSNPNVTTQEDPLDLRRQYLEQLFEKSPDALIVVDSSFRVQCVNREFQRMFGYSDAQTLSQPIDSLILPPDRAAEANWIAQCLQRGEQLTLETQRRHRDGALLDVS
ncbi:MAG: PAS domain S-box protein, partial [Candidatus Sulfotelmatobacter sp.]